MSRALLVAAILVGATSVASAEVTVGAGVPFSADELTHALAARLGDPLPEVVVRGGADGVVEVVALGRLRAVAIGDARGDAAARLVALHVADLVLIVTTTADRAEERHSAAAPAERPVQMETGKSGVARIAMSFGGGRGVAGSDRAMMIGELELAWVTPRWLLAVAVAGWHAPRQAADVIDELGFDAGLLRARAGVRAGGVELAIGPELGRLDVDAVVPRRATVLGAGASARLRGRLDGGLAVMATLAADVLDRRVVVEVDGERRVSTPRLALGVTLGVAWGGR